MDRINYNKIKERSLAQKIIWIIALVLIVPMAIICIFYYRGFQNSLLNDARNQLKETLNDMEISMDTNLDRIDAVINELNYRQEFSYFLDGENVLTEKEQTYYVSGMQGELINIRYLYPNKFYYIAVFSSNNQIKDKYERQYGMEDLKDKPYFNEIIAVKKNISYGMVRNSEFKSSNIILEDLNLDRSGILILPTYLKVYNLSTRQMVGVIEVDMEITKLVEEAVLPAKENKTDYLLFDQSNMLIYRKETLKVEKFLNLEVDNENGIIDYKLGNKTYMLAYSRCERTGLMRAVMIAKHNVLDYANQIILNVLIIALSSLFLVVMMIYWIIKRMLNRLVVLDDMMAKIEVGEFDVSIPVNGEHDEIERISKSFNRMASRLHSVINSVVEKEKAQKEAELKALQAQINPHFLYNTLENMRMQCELEGFYNLGDNLAALGELCHYSIKWGINEVPFELEWTNLINYISIMKMRFGKSMECILERSENTGHIIVPKLLLQPLVENSFNHGFHDEFPPWRIVVRAIRQMDKLVIKIEDNGSGIRDERLKQIRQALKENQSIEDFEKERKSIGIINVKQRLEMICKEGSSLEISSEAGAGTQVVITIMLEEERE